MRRPNECFLLEASEMIVIDYPDLRDSYNLPARPPPQQQQHHLHRQQLQQQKAISAYYNHQYHHLPTSVSSPHLFLMNLPNGGLKSSVLSAATMEQGNHQFRLASSGGVNIVYEDNHVSIVTIVYVFQSLV